MVHTVKQKPMKYNEAINGPDGEAWNAEIEHEHNCILKRNVFEVVKKAALKSETKVLDSTWSYKKGGSKRKT